MKSFHDSIKMRNGLIANVWNGHYNVTRGYSVNGLNQYTLSGDRVLGYDGRGNLTSDGVWTFGCLEEPGHFAGILLARRLTA
jgi:hypothetical protein